LFIIVRMRLLLFDYDGVLADTFDDLIQFGQEACDELGVVHAVTSDDVHGLEVMSYKTFGIACGVPEHQIDVKSNQEAVAGEYISDRYRKYEDERSSVFAAPWIDRSFW